MEGVWEAATPLLLEGRRFLCLSPEDQLLHLTLHLDQHRVSGPVVLVWFCDIHEFIRQHGLQIRWDVLVQRVKSIGVCSQVGTILGLLNAHWKTPIPARILEEMGGRGDEPVLAAAIRQQGDPGEFARRLLRSHRNWLLMVREIQGWGRRLRYLLRIIVPTPVYLRHRYGVEENRSVWPYYLRHPIVKAGQLAKTLPVLLREPSRNEAKAGDG